MGIVKSCSVITWKQTETGCIFGIYTFTLYCFQWSSGNIGKRRAARPSFVAIVTAIKILINTIVISY